MQWQPEQTSYGHRSVTAVAVAGRLQPDLPTLMNSRSFVSAQDRYCRCKTGPDETGLYSSSSSQLQQQHALQAVCQLPPDTHRSPRTTISYLGQACLVLCIDHVVQLDRHVLVAVKELLIQDLQGKEGVSYAEAKATCTTGAPG
jgi:hypothetical protein